MGPSDITLQSIAFRVVALLLMAAVHGCIVAGTAVFLGDRGPKYDGRLTIAPASHIDALGAIGLVIFGLGWGRPVAVDAGELRTGRVGIVVVIIAGFVGLLVLATLLDALVGPALTSLPYTPGLTTAAFLRTASNLAIWFALLSLIPVPPLTGGLLLDAVGVRVPRQAEWILSAALLVAVATGAVRRVLGPAHAVLASLVLGD
jgi:Zn-dependent protease